jgi:hypothetical protein
MVHKGREGKGMGRERKGSYGLFANVSFRHDFQLVELGDVS